MNAALIKYQDKTISSSSPKPSLLKMSTKDASQTPSKRATHVVEQSPSSLSTHMEVVLSKKWTDGSVSWDSLPTALASLGKVLIVQSLEGLALLYFICLHLLLFVREMMRFSCSQIAITLWIKQSCQWVYKVVLGFHQKTLTRKILNRNFCSS